MSGGWERLPEPGSPEDLVARIEKLTARVRNLEEPTGTQAAETVANQVQIDTQSGSAASISVGTGYTTLLTLTFNVPADFSRVTVSAIGFWNAGNNDAMDGARVFQRLVVGGTAGPESIGGLISVATCAFSSTAARTFDVTPGGSFTILLQGRNQVGTTSATFVPICVANATAIATFLR